MKDPASNPVKTQNGVPPVIDTRELVKQHMKDPNHHISDEELNQVQITTDHIDLSAHPLIKALEGRD